MNRRFECAISADDCESKFHEITGRLKLDAFCSLAKDIALNKPYRIELSNGFLNMGNGGGIYFIKTYLEEIKDEPTINS